MPRSTPAVPTVTIPGRTSVMPGSQVAVFAKGTDLYERVRVNGEIRLAAGEAAPQPATVQTVQVGALIDLMATFGPQSVHTYGRPYSALALIQAMTDAAEEDVLDVTRLYTALVVVLPAPALPGPAA